jgi:hypothetical protein
MRETIKVEYELGGAGLGARVTRCKSEVPVLSADEFRDLLAANPVTENFRVGTAAGYPVRGYWSANSGKHPGYIVAMEHIGHGWCRPVAYCYEGDEG